MKEQYTFLIGSAPISEGSPITTKVLSYIRKADTIGVIDNCWILTIDIRTTLGYEYVCLFSRPFKLEIYETTYMSEFNKDFRDCVNEAVSNFQTEFKKEFGWNIDLQVSEDVIRHEIHFSRIWISGHFNAIHQNSN